MILDKMYVYGTDDGGATLQLRQSPDRSSLPASIAAAIKEQQGRVKHELSMASGADTGQMTEIDISQPIYVLFLTAAELASGQGAGLSIPSS